MFFGFIGLKKQPRVESKILFAGENSINTTNPMNPINKFAGFEGWRGGRWLTAVSQKHLTACSLNR